MGMAEWSGGRKSRTEGSTPANGIADGSRSTSRGATKRKLNDTFGSSSQIPNLPPIPQLSAKFREDRFANSKLMTYRLAKEKQNRLLEIMHERALKEYNEMQE